MLVYSRENKSFEALDFREVAPGRATSGMFDGSSESSMYGKWVRCFGSHSDTNKHPHPHPYPNSNAKHFFDIFSLVFYFIKNFFDPLKTRKKSKMKPPNPCRLTNAHPPHTYINAHRQEHAYKLGVNHFSSLSEKSSIKVHMKKKCVNFKCFFSVSFKAIL